jgi:predicted nucleic acid-binding OB-fold protein
MRPKLIRLKRPYFDPRSGNTLFSLPVPILAESVPEHLLNDPSYVEVVEYENDVESEPTQPLEASKPSVESVPYSDSEIEEVKINVKKEPFELKKSVNLNNLESELKKEVEESIQDAININTATEEQLLALRGVGKAIAEKIIKERSERPFESINDLKNRVPLKFGSSQWETLNVVVE